jgi:hypothetical protein
MSGNGSLNSPWDLTTALASADVENNNNTTRTLWLRGGTYSGDFTNILDGVSDRRITIRPYQNETVIIDGDLVVNGSYITFMNLIIRNSSWTGRESDEEETPSDLPTAECNIRAIGVKFINCVIHDMLSPYIGQEAETAEFYGCLSYYHGWLAPIRGHGHALYIQNSVATQMTIKDCIFHDCFGWGLHAYGGQGSLVKNIVVEGNTSFRSGSLSGDARPDFLIGADVGAGDSCQLKSNMSYGGSVGFQAYGDGLTNLVITNNYMPNGKTGGYTATTESGNNWDTVGNTSFLRPNDYDSNRANLTVYNQAQANTVNVDVSSVFGASGTVKAYNAQDYFSDVQTLTITAGVITVNMQAANRTVATPDGWVAPAKTFPDFGAFVLIKQ